jgi:mannose-1-phosphate guanylyltransferase
MSAEARVNANGAPKVTAAVKRPANHAAARYGIVLAGGEGARMRPLISHWLGEDRPKQYCTFVGSRSMLQHTVDRACSVVQGERVVTVIGRGHREFVTGPRNGGLPGLVLEQPLNMGTAAGVFLGLAYVLAVNPEATAIILPSDHYVHPETRFLDHMGNALDLAERHHDRLVLLAAVPDRAETEYGWITPGENGKDGGAPLAHGSMRAVRFQEKPGGEEARARLREGCLWNTMVIAAKAKTLWALARRCLREMACEFDAYLTVLRAIRGGRLAPKFEAGALAGVYSHIVPADFSKDILQHVCDQSIVLPMEGVDWCDWGHPRRVTETLARLGLQPLFQSACPDAIA